MKAIKKTINTISLLLLCYTSFSQNLVPNPSFEDYYSCPNSVGQADSCVGWSSFRITPDYLNTCADNSTNASVPYNIWGYQYPSTGNACMALQTRFTPEAREYLGGQLSSSLIIGQKYYVSFKVNCAFSGLAYANGATNKIGVLFSTTPYSTSTPMPISNFAHVYTDSIITDTLNWTNIQGSFIADSTYNYIVLGNFFDDAHTDTIKLDATPGYFRATYYIDDVVVTTDSLLTVHNEVHGEEFSFTVFPNPVINELNINLNNIHAHSIIIYDSFGHSIYLNEIIPNQNSFNINVTQYPRGIYLLQLLTDKGTLTKKFFITPN